MTRRYISLATLIATTIALAACTNPTAPKAPSTASHADCQVTVGSGTCHG
jgi:hypothetical protein